MKTKILKSLVVLFGAASLLITGCSTSHQGAMGNDTQYGSGSGGSSAPTGADGSASPSNPLALDSGVGLTRGPNPQR
jgi:hypothetical protein